MLQSRPVRSTMMLATNETSTFFRVLTTIRSVSAAQLALLTISLVRYLNNSRCQDLNLTLTGFRAIHLPWHLQGLLPPAQTISWPQAFGLYTITKYRCCMEWRLASIRRSPARTVWRSSPDLTRRTQLPPPRCVARHLRPWS